MLKLNKFKDLYLLQKIKDKKNSVLIGKVARFDPRKDHMNLLKALSLINNKKVIFFVY